MGGANNAEILTKEAASLLHQLKALRETEFIEMAHPERWKLLQVLPVGAQNDGSVPELAITSEQFNRYVARNRRVEELGISVVPENNDLMTGSYVMVDPEGRFFDNMSS